MPTGIKNPEIQTVTDLARIYKDKWDVGCVILLWTFVLFNGMAKSIFKTGEKTGEIIAM